MVVTRPRALGVKCVLPKFPNFALSAYLSPSSCTIFMLMSCASGSGVAVVLRSVIGTTVRPALPPSSYVAAMIRFA